MKFCVFPPWLEFATPPVIAAFPFQSNQHLFWIRGAFTPAPGAGGQDSQIAGLNPLPFEFRQDFQLVKLPRK
jgi:hypothetical protein